MEGVAGAKTQGVKKTVSRHLPAVWCPRLILC